MPDIPEGMAPARYKGHGVGLREGNYYNTDGSKRKRLVDGTPVDNLSLEPGDELLLQDEDVYGKTLLFDPQGNRQPLYLGLGRVVKPEHADLSDKERAELGYERHLGRPDFEPIEPLEKFLKRREKAGKKEKPKEVPQSVVVGQPANVSAEQGESEES